MAQHQQREAGPTVIVAHRVRAEFQVQFEQWNERLMNAAMQFEGYLGWCRHPHVGAHPFRDPTPELLA